MTKRDYSYCDVHDWWTGAADVWCPHCVELNNLRAELRWCDAERRLALRALAEYAPMCDECLAEWRELRRDVLAMRHATNELRGRVYCDEHLHADRPIVCAAQIAAADEETGR